MQTGTAMGFVRKAFHPGSSGQAPSRVSMEAGPRLCLKALHESLSGLRVGRPICFTHHEVETPLSEVCPEGPAPWVALGPGPSVTYKRLAGGGIGPRGQEGDIYPRSQQAVQPVILKPLSCVCLVGLGSRDGRLGQLVY